MASDRQTDRLTCAIKWDFGDPFFLLSKDGIVLRISCDAHDVLVILFRELNVK